MSINVIYHIESMSLLTVLTVLEMSYISSKCLKFSNSSNSSPICPRYIINFIRGMHHYEYMSNKSSRVFTVPPVGVAQSIACAVCSFWPPLLCGIERDLHKLKRNI